MSEEVAEIHRVPGEFRCLGCGARVSRPEAAERPECPECGRRCVPLTWKRYGPEQQAALRRLTGAVDAALAERTEWERRCWAVTEQLDRVRGEVTQVREHLGGQLERQRKALTQAAVWLTVGAFLLGLLLGSWAGTAETRAVPAGPAGPAGPGQGAIQEGGKPMRRALKAIRRRASGGASVSITDAFGDADSALTLGSTDTGEAWTAHRGTWGITGGQAYQVADDATGYNSATVPAGTANGTAQVTFATVPGASGGTAQLVFRLTDGDNYLYVEGYASDLYHLYRREAGVSTLIGSSAVVPASGDVVKVVLSGTSITLYVNDVEALAATSSFNQSATRHGLGGQYGIDGGARWDAFSFTA